MSYCPYCGTQVSETMSFCPNCGAQLTSGAASNISTTAATTAYGDYRIYIAGLGTANKAQLVDLLEDTLGYTTSAASNLVNNLPAQIAGNLTLQQAAVIAQAFEEYGVQLSVTNGEEAADISSQTSSSSLFNTDGSFLASAALVLGSLTAANRISSIVRPKKPALLDRIFHSLFNVRRKPPVHVRRTIRPAYREVRPAPPQPAKRAMRTRPVQRNARKPMRESSNPSMNRGMNGRSGGGPGRH